MENSGFSAESMDLKAREMLKEVQLDYDSVALTRFIDDTVSAIRESIDKIPEDLKVGADEAPGFIRDIGADKVDFTFKKPKSIEIAGSYAIRSVAKPYTGVDLFLRLPKECFLEKDYLNHRYHGKRCIYLCIIKKYVGFSSLIKTIEWSTFENEARKPILVVYPVQEYVELPKFFIRIIPTATSLFNVSKLNMSRNNVRALSLGNNAQATPNYNSSILEDMFMEDNEDFVRKTFIGWKESGEALILLKVWARNRSHIYCYDCLNGFLISFIMAYLANELGGNRINKSMKAMQIFRVTLDFIATSKLWDKGLLLQPQGRCSVTKEDRRQYQQLFHVVLFDSSAHFNLAFRVSKSGFLELRDEASLTLNCMDKCIDGGFEGAFMTQVDFPAKYDYCIRMNLEGNSEVYASGVFLDKECWRTYEDKVRILLEQGLNDRAKFIRVTWRNSSSEFDVKEGLSEHVSDPLLVGILASSSEKSFRMVDIGPNAENKEEVSKFRRFWGEKAELRRFKDGTIAESTVWECEQWERHLIMKRIMEFVLLRHLSLSKENLVVLSDQLDFCLLNGVRDPVSSCGTLIGAFEALSKRLRHLEDIPLRVSSVQPLDSAFRLTSVFPPQPHPLANEKSAGHKSQKLFSTCIEPLEVMIQLEGSGNWPMDDVAIQKTKSAFLLKIGESLENGWGVTCIATEDEVDVLMSGYAFRLRILHERGVNLSKKQHGNDQMRQVTSIDKELFARGQHSSMINGLQGIYPTYGPVVRLAKRWMASHLFSAFLAEEAIELLVAYLFLKPLPFYAPCSRITGFLRFLRLLSNYDWTFSPLIIDINNDLTPTDEKEINENFMSTRKSYEENTANMEPAMFLATSYDKASIAWTRVSPNTSELRRMVAYARSSSEYLTKLILQSQVDSHRWESLFRTPLNNYDVVILLHSDRLPFPQRRLFSNEITQGRRVAQGKASKEFNPYIILSELQGSLEDKKSKLMVNFDPLRCFVEDTKKEFPNMFKLWYDAIGGDAIGLTWEQRVSKKRAREEMDKEEEKQDPIEVLRTIGRTGKGFVRSVHLLKAGRS